MAEKRIFICDMCGLESENRDDIKSHDEYMFQAFSDSYITFRNTHDAPKEICCDCAKKTLMLALEKHAVPKTTAIYKLTNSKLPYPRVEYKCSCGLLWVVWDGYKKDKYNHFTQELNTPTGNCVKCRMPINCDLTNDATDTASHLTNGSSTAVQ